MKKMSSKIWWCTPCNCIKNKNGHQNSLETKKNLNIRCGLFRSPARPFQSAKKTLKMSCDSPFNLKYYSTITSDLFIWFFLPRYLFLAMSEKQILTLFNWKTSIINSLFLVANTRNETLHSCQTFVLNSPSRVSLHRPGHVSSLVIL